MADGRPHRCTLHLRSATGGVRAGVLIALAVGLSTGCGEAADFLEDADLRVEVVGLDTAAQSVDVEVRGAADLSTVRRAAVDGDGLTVYFVELPGPAVELELRVMGAGVPVQCWSQAVERSARVISVDLATVDSSCGTVESASDAEVTGDAVVDAGRGNNGQGNGRGPANNNGNGKDD